MGKIAILHTTPATIVPLGNLLRESCPGVVIENFMDDSILPALLADENALSTSFEKLLCYAKFAEQQGNKIILSACSSVGAFCDWAADKLEVPLVRIDDAVSSIAADRSEHIIVLATLSTTLKPSCELIRRKASAKTVIESVLVEGAFDALCNGDKEQHDKLIIKAITEACKQSDTIYLAQASMAQTSPQLSLEEQQKILTSTVPAIQQVAKIYHNLYR